MGLPGQLDLDLHNALLPGNPEIGDVWRKIYFPACISNNYMLLRR